MTYSILIDSSTKTLQMALSHNGHVLDVLYGNEQKDQSQFLISFLDLLLTKHNISKNQLSYVSVGTGPGSFTGIRIGMIFADALTYGLQIPLYSFCSLQQYVPKKEGKFLILASARNREFYMLQGEKKEQQIFYEETPKLIKQEDWECLPKNFTYYGRETLPSFPYPLILLTPSFQVIANSIYQHFLQAPKKSTQSPEPIYADPLLLS